MGTTYETGHARNVANLKKLMEQVAVFAEYNPSVTPLRLEHLNTLYTQALNCVAQVEAERVAYKNAAHTRQHAYKPLKSTTTRILNHLYLLNLPAGTLAQAKRWVRAIRGDHPLKKTPQNPAENTTATISTSRQSYTQRAENFSKLLQLLATIPTYTPNTEDLKLPALTTYHTQLVGATEGVDQAQAVFNKALIVRNKCLYATATGLYTLAQNVKKYVKSLYGANAPQYQKVLRIYFKSY